MKNQDLGSDSNSFGMEGNSGHDSEPGWFLACIPVMIRLICCLPGRWREVRSFWDVLQMNWGMRRFSHLRERCRRNLSESWMNICADSKNLILSAHNWIFVMELWGLVCFGKSTDKSHKLFNIFQWLLTFIIPQGNMWL